MSDFRPFCGYRPAPAFAAHIAAPPYDVLDSEEARRLAAGNELSFLHVSKPEIDLPPGTDPYAARVYETGAANLRRLIERGYLRRDETPHFYVYRLRMGRHVQTGVVGAASVADYEQNLIKKHELTRSDKEDDRTWHIEITNANTGPVFLAYRPSPAVNRAVESIVTGEPAFDFTAEDEVTHTLWPVGDETLVAQLREGFQRTPCLYVADGHHRSAAAVRVARTRRARNPHHTGQEAYNHFLAVAFPADQLQILPYNRVVADLAGLSADQFLGELRKVFDAVATDQPAPSQLHHFGLYLGGQWYRLVAKPGTYPAHDVVRCLDVQLLSDNVLGPLLHITDLRTDQRIGFVGGIRGAAELARLVDSGRYAAAFAMFPTTVEQLMTIADAGMIMPPKSTWFEPKLRSGIVVRLLDD